MAGILSYSNQIVNLMVTYHYTSIKLYQFYYFCASLNYFIFFFVHSSFLFLLVDNLLRTVALAPTSCLDDVLRNIYLSDIASCGLTAV